VLYPELSTKIFDAAYAVHRALGPGLLEKVYQNALVIELRNSKIPFEIEKPLTITYKNHNLGSFYADIAIDEKIILEIKAISRVNRLAEAQLINYLNISKYKLGFLLNFGNLKLETKRFILTNPD
jgi:GxxExxY protein